MDNNFSSILLLPHVICILLTVWSEEFEVSVLLYVKMRLKGARCENTDARLEENYFVRL